jgi:hypothetical protein
MNDVNTRDSSPLNAKALHMKDFLAKRAMIYLLIAIPAAAVVMGVVTAYLAITTPEAVVEREAPPLSKTSWRQQP